MQPVQAAQLLEVWERGYGQRPADRALAALSAAWPDMSQGELAALSIGRRDAMLLTLRESVFGPRLFGLTVCPTCGERLELTLELRVVASDGPSEVFLGERSIETHQHIFFGSEDAHHDA